MNIKKGDNVKILKGKDAGKTGKVIRVSEKDNKITIDGLNVFKKHSKPKRQGQKGEIVNVVRPLDVSNAQIVCPSCNKATRVGHRINEKQKTRYCKKCNAAI
ncbi:MAG: 50S ribosomal protein L24 [Patescibacteria group bacterium]